ncbi:MAG: secondary thiamine-phosphate synthase enzyme YjbQ [Pseudomonadales bacterium]|nr:secondary thiamine-phosphate synthase enzyme YjbQ [Pseudomonadales bacterium]MDP7357597.1 secondary thiamine-phosphate synthase enzyme YjbQ [Pseudomonadales bacterium]MDP7595018.1 secondary thiamine-phosphate synthase enzyme YjbQ [Pseudomonadales bacterium]HJN51423.1 secondary thiamine-phosphate synthase enzyme YjbQ [Pseudomonadales bacterium]
MIKTLSIKINGKGLHDITPLVAGEVESSGVDEGLCSLFIQHTSASLLIQENYDPSAKTDLERWFDRLVPENDPIYTHTTEGPDDMPAHIKAALTATSLSIPVIGGSLALGSWQGIFLWEQRHHRGSRRVVVHL